MLNFHSAFSFEYYKYKPYDNGIGLGIDYEVKKKHKKLSELSIKKLESLLMCLFPLCILTIVSHLDVYLSRQFQL